MRADQRDEQHPRLAARFGRPCLQPIDRRSGDLVVIVLVARIAAPKGLLKMRHTAFSDVQHVHPYGGTAPLNNGGRSGP